MAPAKPTRPAPADLGAGPGQDLEGLGGPAVTGPPERDVEGLGPGGDVDHLDSPPPPPGARRRPPELPPDARAAGDEDPLDAQAADRCEAYDGGLGEAEREEDRLDSRDGAGTRSR